MLAYILALLWALANPTPTCTNHNNGGQVTTMDDTGGETGPVKPPKPPIP